MLEGSWSEHKDTSCHGLNWERFTGVEQAKVDHSHKLQFLYVGHEAASREQYAWYSVLKQSV